MTVSCLEHMMTKGFNERRSGTVSDGGLEVRDMGNSYPRHKGKKSVALHSLASAAKGDTLLQGVLSAATTT